MSIEPIAHDKDIIIKSEKYYAVDYVDRYYIGRVLGQGSETGFYKMKFLHHITNNGKPTFYWPKKDDLDNVFHGNIFFWTSRAGGLWIIHLFQFG